MLTVRCKKCSKLMKIAKRIGNGRYMHPKCKNPTIKRTYNPATHLFTKYKIRFAEWEVLKNKQESKCAICLLELPLCVDHNHKTGKIRGLLCSNCNTALGLYKEDPIRLGNAIKYLEASTC